MVSRCFPGGYNVKLYISRGRLAWWLLAFLCCDTHEESIPPLMVVCSKVPQWHEILGNDPDVMGSNLGQIELRSVLPLSASDLKLQIIVYKEVFFSHSLLFHATLG